jgi:hypothetical protein
MGEALWPRRLRWRLRGATLWPAFAVAVVVDGVLLNQLPIAGDDGPALFPAMILAGFANLIVVAVVAPLAGLWLRSRRPSTPRVVAADQAGTALLVVVALAILALGLAHRPAVRAARDDLEVQAVWARRFVLGHAPREFQAGGDHLNTWKQGATLYRTCAPGPDPRRAFCMIVDTSMSPPKVAPDRDQRPNAVALPPG